MKSILRHTAYNQETYDRGIKWIEEQDAKVLSKQLIDKEYDGLIRDNKPYYGCTRCGYNITLAPSSIGMYITLQNFVTGDSLALSDGSDF
jgi:hypothetical protein